MKKENNFKGFVIKLSITFLFIFMFLLMFGFLFPQIEQEIIIEQEAKLNLIKDNGVGDKYLADDGTYKVVSGGGDGGKDFHRVRIFNENGNLIQTQVVYDGEKISRIELEPNKFLFEYGTENSFSYATKIYEDIDLVLGDMPARYVQTTVEDFDESGNYTGSESYIILPSDKPDGYKIVNPDVIGVATNGDDLTNVSYMFKDNPSLYLELDYLDTSNVTDMSYMFDGIQATTLDLSSFDTSNVTTMWAMFIRSQATTLDLSSFDTSNVTSMRSMFNTSEVTTLDLSSFDTSNVTTMEAMFQDSQATTLDLSSFDTSNVTIMWAMFLRSQATTGYARTQADADKFNNSSGKPSTLTFVVK